MVLTETKFADFLLDLGYSGSSVQRYISCLKNFAAHNGYESISDIANEVFILLDKGIHSERKFGYKKLSEIKKYTTALTLLNCYLFDVCYPRDFIVPYYSRTDMMYFLMTDKKYIPGKQARTLIGDNGKQYFNIEDVKKALHVNEKTLQRWADCGKEPYRYKGIPPEIKNNDDEIRKYNNGTLFNYYYYKLKELNEFLYYQFRYGTKTKKERYMSD